MPSTVNVTANRMVETLLRPGGYSVAQMELLFELFLFTRGIRFVRAFDTGPIKERSGLEQRQSQPSGPCQWCKGLVWMRRQKLISSRKIAVVVESNNDRCAQERDFHLRRRSVGRVHCIRFGRYSNVLPAIVFYRLGIRGGKVCFLCLTCRQFEKDGDTARFACDCGKTYNKRN
jgi:hypothetical protein